MCIACKHPLHDGRECGQERVLEHVVMVGIVRQNRTETKRCKCRKSQAQIKPSSPRRRRGRRA